MNITTTIVLDPRVMECKHPNLRRALASSQNSSEPNTPWLACPLASSRSRRSEMSPTPWQSGFARLVSDTLHTLFYRF